MTEENEQPQYPRRPPPIPITPPTIESPKNNFCIKLIIILFSIVFGMALGVCLMSIAISYQ